MEEKQHTPGVRSRRAGVYTPVIYKGNQFYLNSTEFRVFSLLMQGGKFATFDISNSLNIPDPRSVIRYLRKMGIGVADLWCRGEYGVKFKRYFIHQSESVCQQ